jgi:hypothetical protein
LVEVVVLSSGEGRVIKRTMIVLTAILLVACGSSLAATTHPTPNPTVDPTEVTLALTREADFTEASETAEAFYGDMLEATEEAGDIQAQLKMDQDMYTELLSERVLGNELRAPPYPRATATAEAIICAARFLPYESKFATETAVASTPTLRP